MQLNSHVEIQFAIVRFSTKNVKIERVLHLQGGDMARPDRGRSFGFRKTVPVLIYAISLKAYAYNCK